MSKIERVYLRGDFGLTGLYCKAHDVDQLEAQNAELLKGLEAIENGVKIGLPMGEILHIAKKYRKAAARAVIAKAEGGTDETT